MEKIYDKLSEIELDLQDDYNTTIGESIADIGESLREIVILLKKHLKEED